MFCQLELLQSCLRSRVRSVLLDLPESLDETYERILADILKANPDQAYRLLQYLIAATQPVHVDELAEIFALNFPDTEDGIPVLNKDWRSDDKQRGALATCSSLIVVVDSYDNNLGRNTRFVRFAHFSVKMFLISKRLADIKADISRFHIRLEPAHTITAKSCLAILLQSDQDGRADSTSALYKYAAQHWVDHAHIGNVSSQKYEMRRLFDPTKPYFTAWLNSYDPDVEWTSFLRDNSDSFQSWPQRSKFTSFGEDDAPLCLYYAALCEFNDLTGYLITKYPQHVNATVGLNKSPLVAALRNKRVQVAELLHLHGAVLPIGYNSRTPLHAASADGVADVAQWLLDIGADANAYTESRETPLYFAAMNGHLELVRILLSHGADVNAATTDNYTPLHKASSGGHINVVQLLIEKGADVNAQDESQLTPLLCAKDVKTMRLFIPYRAAIQGRNESQSTPLHIASSRLDAETVKLLIESGADVHARDESQSTPLHYAQNAEIVQLLIKHGADVHTQDESQSTPLHLASSRLNAEIVRLLVEKGADVNARDESQSTPLHRVLYGKRDIISPLVIDHGANTTSEIIQILIENGADVNAQDQTQSTPLHLASSSWDVKVTQLLIKHGADVHAENQDQSTPLHIASSLSFSMNMGTTVRLLIKHGANVNACDKNHQTPLHRVSSCWDPNSDSLCLLLENGADVNVEDNKGLTPFEIASQGNRHDKITQLLFDHRTSMI